MKFFAKNRDLAGRAGLHGLNWLPNSDSKHIVMISHHAKNQLDSSRRSSYPIVKKVNNDDNDTHQVDL